MSGPSVAQPTAAAPRPVAPKSPRAQVTLPDLLRALRQPTEPIRLPLLYRPAQLLVAAVMLVLPLLYLLVIASLVAATAAHAYYDGWLLDPGSTGIRNGKVWLIVVVLGYFGPILAGTLGALFMVKPFFAPAPPIDVPLTLTEADQPALFAFVHELCDVLEAPRPIAIDVEPRPNASASLNRGWRGLLRGDLRLTIGLPLAADLSLPQFAGVLAHEFGHFAQGGGMRLSLIIDMINRWFARVVYERDTWDEALRAHAQESHWLVMVCCWFTMLMVGIGRLVLWVLMIVGHAVSCVLGRQMEYDADRFASRIAGASAFISGMRRIVLLGTCGSFALQAAGQRFGQKRELPDDLPGMMRVIRKRLPEQLQAAILGDAERRKTGLLDTHPSMAARFRQLEAEGDPGVLPFNVPARVLFRDFDKLCRLATAAHYQRALGDNYAHARLVPAAEVAPEFKVAAAPA